MNTRTKHNMLKQMIERSIARHENMKAAINFGITDFRGYQDSLEKVVNKEVKFIIHLTTEK